jgi:BMFP domain-containing protein YqiC
MTTPSNESVVAELHALLDQAVSKVGGDAATHVRDLLADVKTRLDSLFGQAETDAADTAKEAEGDVQQVTTDATTSGQSGQTGQQDVPSQATPPATA